MIDSEARWNGRLRSVVLAGASLTTLWASSMGWGQTTASWLAPVSGTWSDATKWSTNPNYPRNSTPPGTLYDVIIAATGSPYDVTIRNNVEVTSLDLVSPDARLFLENRARFGVNLITGAGEMVFNGSFPDSSIGPASESGSLTIGPGILIRSSPISGFQDRLSAGYMLNQGTISAQTAGHAIIGEATFTNAGVIRAANGGRLLLERLHGDIGSMLLESGGIIELEGNYLNQNPRSIVDGSHLSLEGIWSNSSSIEVNSAALSLGGTPTSMGSISLQNAELRIISALTTAQILSTNRQNSIVTVAFPGVVNNSGTSIVNDPASSTWELAGGAISGGAIASVDGAPFRVVGGATLSGVSLHSPVILESGTLRLVGSQNHATITMNGGTLELQGTTTTGSLGTIVRNGGALSLAGTLNNSGAALDLVSQGLGTLHVRNGGWIIGGTVIGGEGAGILIGNETSRREGTFSGATIQSDVSVVGAQLAIANNLTLNGTIRLRGSEQYYDRADLRFSGLNGVTGLGTIIFYQSGSAHWVAGGTTVTLGSEISLRAEASHVVVLSVLANEGTMTAAGAGSVLEFPGIINNVGLVEAREGGLVCLVDATIGGYAANTLSDGRWAVHSGSTLNMGISTILANNADVLLDGLGSDFAQINPMHTNLGTFAIDHGRNFITAGSLNNSGLLGIGTNSTLYVSGALNNTGSIDLVGMLIVDYDPGESESAIFDTLAGQIGTGILSSIVDPTKGIGSADNALLGYTTFGGQDVDLTSVLMMCTFLGDANLDGVTDLDDFDLLMGGYGPAEGSTLWLSGDFDYSGLVNLSDFELYLKGYYALGGSTEGITNAVNDAPLSESDKQAMFGLIATVPEPAGGGMVGLLGAAVLCRRRTSSRKQAPSSN